VLIDKLTNRSTWSINRCSLFRRPEDSKDPAAGASRVEVTCLRMARSSGSRALLTLFMDHARAARYLHPRYEDEKSDDYILYLLQQLFLRGWLGLRNLSSSLLLISDLFFLFIALYYAKYLYHLFLLFLPKIHSLNRCPSQMTMRSIFNPSSFMTYAYTTVDMPGFVLYISF